MTIYTEMLPPAIIETLQTYDQGVLHVDAIADDTAFFT
jgi:hypothetical protein